MHEAGMDELEVMNQQYKSIKNQNILLNMQCIPII